MKRIVLSVILLSASAMVIAVASPGMIEHVLRQSRAGEPAEIGHHARWNASCAALDAPRLTIERAPDYGRLCVNKGQVQLVVSRSSAGQSCIGRSINGVHVVYIPRSGFTGTDTLRYALDVPEGHVSLEVSITVGSGTMKSSPSSTSVMSNTQPSGPIPECPSLAS